MNKLFMILGAVILIGIVIIAVMYMGLLPGMEMFIKADTPALSGGTDQNCNYNERDIYTAVCGMAGKSFNYNEFQSYSDSLEFKLCGVDGYTSINTINDFKSSYEAQGMTLELEQPVGGTYWSGTLCLWGHHGVVYGLVAGEGSAVESVFNKDVMYLTGKGTMMEWQQFLVWATS